MSMAIVGIASAGASLLGSVFGAIGAKKAKKAAQKQANKLNAELTHLEQTRQEIINPYASTEDLSGLVTDLSGMINNPYANIGVATQAAEMQMEQTDMALANTLDTIRASGSSAGGATALAQAALQSKQSVSANIESQEANNEKLRAQGEQQMQQIQLGQAQRVQDIQLSEGQRIQSAEAAGAQFMFQTKEGREMQKMDRTAAQLSGQQQAAVQAQGDYMGAIMGGVSAVGAIGGAAAGAEKNIVAPNVV